MNIVFIGSGVVSIPPKKGGATELIILEQSKFLSKCHNVTVFDLKETSNRKREKIGSAQYERFSVPRLNNIFFLRLSEFIFGLRAITKSRIKSPDIVHCQTVFSALPFVLLKPFVKGKVIYTSHNPAWTADKNDVFNELILWIEGLVMKKSDAITTVSYAMQEGIMKRTKIEKEKINVVYNFVDTKKFSPKGYGWKKRKGIKGKIVLFVGKLSPNKGVEYFIRSASIVKSKMPDVKFVLVGPISFEQNTKNRWKDMAVDLGVEDTVIFAGPASDEELPYAYSSADLFCFPTLKEAFGIVIIEAMSCGLPVVTTDLPVIREITDNKAVFVKEKDSIGVANAVENMLRNKQSSNKFRSMSLKRSIFFEKNNILKNYEAVYLQVLGDHK